MKILWCLIAHRFPRKVAVFLPLFVALYIFCILLSCSSKGLVQSNSLAFANVTDVDGTRNIARATVVIQRNRIITVSNGKVELPPKTTVIDGSGKFLIPGLWDMHVHVQRDPDILYPLFVANGVTGVRDMGGPLNELKKWRSQIAAEERIGPRIFLAGPYLDGPGSTWAFSRTVETSDEATNAVGQLKSEGVDFIKVQSWLPRDAYFAIVQEARKANLPFVGHVPDAISVVEAAEVGQKSIEHMTGILVACSSEENRLRQLALDHSKGIAAQVLKEAIESYDKNKASALFQLLATREVWQAPTLVVWNARASAEDDHLVEDTRLRYVPASMRRYWESDNSRQQVRGLSHPYVLIAGQVLKKHMELIPRMRAAGVKFLAGTDTPFPFCIPGFSLHEELKLLERSGFSPMEALQTATFNPAVFLGLQDRLGTIEEGKWADLVLLNGDPTKDIENISRIEAVVVNGRYYSRKDLDGILAEASVLAEKR